MKSFFKVAAVACACAVVFAIGYGCACSKTEEKAPAPAPAPSADDKKPVEDNTPDPVLDGTGEWTFQDPDGTYWAVTTEISKDDRSITVNLPMEDIEEWSYSMSPEKSPLDILGEPNVDKKGKMWSATFSGAGIDATGDVEVTFVLKYPAGAQSDHRHFTMKVNVADDDSITLIDKFGEGFDSEE